MELQLINLAVARGGVAVLDGVTLALSAGQAMVLRGANGIGKTTLLRAVAGLQPVLRGQIVVPEEGVAYGSHADGVKATLTVAENMRFWARVYGTGEIADALRAMDLTSLADRRAGEVSAGQKRRLGLARLLVTGRKVWLLDEPTVALDTASVALFGAVVRAHLAAGGVALMATHIDLNLPEARDMDLTQYRARPNADRSDDFAADFT